MGSKKLKSFYNLFKSLSKIKPRANSRKPYIVPTGLGFSYAALIFMIVIISVNNKNTLIFLFSFFLFSVGLTVMIFTHRNLEKITLEFLQSSLLFKSDQGTLDYLITNNSKIICYEITAKIYGSPESVLVEKLSAGGAQKIQLKFTPENYGHTTLPDVVIESRFPLQFLRVWKVINPPFKLMVFPEKINFLAAKPSEPTEKDFAGQKLIGLENHEELSHFEKYNELDSPQHINWKILAKTNELYVNKYLSDKNEDLDFIVDWKNTSPLDHIEKKKSQFTFWLDYFFKLKKNFVVIYNDTPTVIVKNDQRSLQKILTTVALDPGHFS